jgi:hypothetical protein
MACPSPPEGSWGGAKTMEGRPWERAKMRGSQGSSGARFKLAMEEGLCHSARPALPAGLFSTPGARDENDEETLRDADRRNSVQAARGRRGRQGD